MKLKVCLAAGVLVLSSFAAFAADQPQKKEMSPQEKAAMEAMMRAATPGEQHKKLANLVGTWNAEVKMWNAPGAPPMVSRGVSTSTVVLGGRYVQEEFKGEFMGMPFNGIGFWGYDNAAKQYTGTWMDTASTSPMTSTGNLEGDTYNFTSAMTDPMSGKRIESTTKMRIESGDKHVMEMWDKAPDGSPVKVMEITYTRKKS